MRIKDTARHCGTGEVFNIPPYLIQPNHLLSRTNFPDTSLCSLADSIRRYGILQPLAVRLSKDGKYELIAGERRLRAAVLLRLPTVPCVILGNTVDEESTQYLSVVENLQREKLNMFDEARAIKRIYERCGRDSAECARILSTSVAQLEKKLGLLEFSRAEMQEILSLGISCERALLFADMPKGIRYFAIKLCSESELPDRLVRELSERLKSEKATSSQSLEDMINELLKNTYGAKPEEVREESPQNESGNVKIILHDLGIFEATLERACDVLTRAGLDVVFEKAEESGEVVYSIKVKV